MDGKKGAAPVMGQCAALAADPHTGGNGPLGKYRELFCAAVVQDVRGRSHAVILPGVNRP